jgi:DNA-3-methyladenine glycosylase II
MTAVRIFPKPPFDFSLSAAIFGTGDSDIRFFRDGVFSLALAITGGPVLAEVRSVGSPEKPGLILTISSGRPVSRAHTKETQAPISRILSITDDLAPFYTAVAADPLLADIALQLRGVKAPTTPTVFEALTDSIIEQQISLKAARSIENRLIRLTGQPIEHDGKTWYCYPEPTALPSYLTTCTVRAA